MFTIEEIKQAHAKVKSGADFPPYVQAISKFGVRSYETYVTDGHTDYYGENGYKVTSPPKYEQLTIAEDSNTAQFKINLKDHQQGKTDYLTFCKISAKLGVEKWVVSIEAMTCSYIDKTGNEMLVEVIPRVG